MTQTIRPTERTVFMNCGSMVVCGNNAAVSFLKKRHNFFRMTHESLNDGELQLCLKFIILHQNVASANRFMIVSQWCGSVYAPALSNVIIASDYMFPVCVWAAGPLQSGAFGLQIKEAESVAGLRGGGRAGVLLRPARHRRCSKQRPRKCLCSKFPWQPPLTFWRCWFGT